MCHLNWPAQSQYLLGAVSNFSGNPYFSFTCYLPTPHHTLRNAFLHLVTELTLQTQGNIECHRLSIIKFCQLCLAPHHQWQEQYLVPDK